MAVAVRKPWEQSAVEGDLKYWGYHQGKLLAADGASPENVIARLLIGTCPRPGHRILVADIPHRAWKINAVITRFPEQLRAALIARYCVPPDYDTGQLRTIDELSQALKWTRDQYRRRLTEAKARYRLHLFGY